MKKEFDWQSIEALMNEIADQQRKHLLGCAKKIVPHVTPDDLLQPNDFPELENHPLFRYEEGVLAGIQTIEMALRALNRKTIDKLDSLD